jgi:hypothetical protein
MVVVNGSLSSLGNSYLAAEQPPSMCPAISPIAGHHRPSKFDDSMKSTSPSREFRSVGHLRHRLQSGQFYDLPIKFPPLIGTDGINLFARSLKCR